MTKGYTDILQTCDKVLEQIQVATCGTGDGFEIVRALSNEYPITKLAKSRNVAPVMLYKHWYGLGCPQLKVLKQMPFLYRLAVGRHLFDFTLQQLGEMMNTTGARINDKIHRYTGHYVTAWAKRYTHDRILSDYKRMLVHHKDSIQRFSFPIRQPQYEQLSFIQT